VQLSQSSLEYLQLLRALRNCTLIAVVWREASTGKV